MSRDYALAVELQKAVNCYELEKALLTPAERRRGIKLVGGNLRKYAIRVHRKRLAAQKRQSA